MSQESTEISFLKQEKGLNLSGPEVTIVARFIAIQSKSLSSKQPKNYIWFQRLKIEE